MVWRIRAQNPAGATGTVHQTPSCRKEEFQTQRTQFQLLTFFLIVDVLFLLVWVWNQGLGCLLGMLSVYCVFGSNVSHVAQTGLELLYLMSHCLSFPGIWDSGSQPQRPGRRFFFWGGRGAQHAHASLQRSDKGAGSPRTGVTGICKSPFPQCVLGNKLVSVLLMGHRSSPCITFLYNYLKAHCS